MTETSPLGTMAHPPAGLGPEEEWPYRITQGRFPAGVEARLVGPGGDLLAWDGESAGELEVRGTGSRAPTTAVRPAKLHARGQVQRRRLAQDRRRGCHQPDGYLTLTDRAKDVIKSGGEWISSVELENA